MSKRRPSSKGSRQTDKTPHPRSDRGSPQDGRGAAGTQPTSKHVPSPAAIRETIESVVVAFVLAFLFRTFEAEAFVIPTGSMAPTLMGRHKDLECPECNYGFQVSASDEVDSETNVPKGPGYWVVGWTCPMCGHPVNLHTDVVTELAGEIEGKSPRQQEKIVTEALEEKLKPYPSYKGDRILVGKFCYQFSEPKRWDVAVFKYPGGAKTNFIKRLVGLPGETIRIQHGDIFVKRGEDDHPIARKDRPEKLLAMLQPVYDNDFVLPKIIELGWPARWQPWPSADGSSEGRWTTAKDYRSFRTTGRPDEETWLRYEHVVPSPDDWKRYLGPEQQVPQGAARHQLISDFCAYNTCLLADSGYADPASTGLHWVGDLAVQCTLEALSGSGQAILELVEGGWRMQCRIDLATGQANLAVEHQDAWRRATTVDGQDYQPTAQTKVRGPGKHEIIFSNCDDQLRLWVDGREVEFDTSTCYAPLENWMPQDGSFASDLFPVGLGSQGAELRISHLKVLRDVYYIAERRDSSSREPLTDFRQSISPGILLSDPAQWGTFANMKQAEFPLGADQFLALGDNSPKSKDSRLWEQDNFEYYVSRELLVGKALYIYWPHSWNKVPGTEIPFPLFPNFAGMGFVR